MTALASQPHREQRASHHRQQRGLRDARRLVDAEQEEAAGPVVIRRSNERLNVPPSATAPTNDRPPGDATMLPNSPDGLETFRNSTSRSGLASIDWNVRWKSLQATPLSLRTRSSMWSVCVPADGPPSTMKGTSPSDVKAFSSVADPADWLAMLPVPPVEGKLLNGFWPT